MRRDRRDSCSMETRGPSREHGRESWGMTWERFGELGVHKIDIEGSGQDDSLSAQLSGCHLPWENPLCSFSVPRVTLVHSKCQINTC